MVQANFAKKNHTSELRQALVDALNETLKDDISPQLVVEDHWSVLKRTAYGASKSVLGHPLRRHTDWFDENDIEINNLLHETRTAHIAKLNSAETVSNNQLQQKLRKMEDSWWSNKATEMQQLHEANKLRGFHQELKYLSKRQSSNHPVLPCDGKTVYSSNKDILNQWCD